MALMKIRQMATESMRSRWPLSLFQGPASVVKVFAYSAFAILIGGLSFWLMIVNGNGSAKLGLLFATIIALAAHAQWLSVKEARNKELLPKRILCPSCEASIVLRADERQDGRFACPACGEDFEIINEKGAAGR